MDEKSLLKALKNGDRIAFDVVFNRYASDIFYFSLDLTKNEDEAEEILQETFVKLWEYRKNIDADRNIRNYIISIAKSLIYNALKRKIIERKYLSEIPPYIDSSDTESELHQDDLRNILLGYFDKLTPHQKKILILKSKGLNNQEIADLLNISQRTVESHITKAYKRLRADLYYPEDIFLLLLPLIICLL